MTDDRDRQLDKVASGTLRWLGSAISSFLQQPLILVVLFGVFVSGSGQIIKVGGAERWVLVASTAVLACASGLILWRSRTRQRSLVLEQANRALEKQANAARALGEVRDEQAKLRNEQMSVELANSRRERVYSHLKDDVANGLSFALERRRADSAANDPVTFIEDNSLRAINETFAGELATDRVRPRIETGIAVRTDVGLRVTHASGPETLALKNRGDCLTGGKEIEEVLERKATARFRKGGWHVVRLTGLEPPQYLFILSDVELGKVEHDALKQQATLVKLTAAALAPETPEAPETPGTAETSGT